MLFIVALHCAVVFIRFSNEGDAFYHDHDVVVTIESSEHLSARCQHLLRTSWLAISSSEIHTNKTSILSRNLSLSIRFL